MTVFSALILNGLYLGIRIETIVLRAVAGLFGGLVLGLVMGRLAVLVFNDNRSPKRGMSPAGDEIA